MITVEPPDIPWLFSAGSTAARPSGGGLEFLNTYSFEIHTHDLVYQPNSTYRLFKAPIGQSFDDITDDVLSGSVRARGRHGAFSQFLIASDTADRVPPLPFLCAPILEKTVALELRIVGSILGDVLRLDLLNLLSKVVALLPLDPIGAVAVLDELIGEIDANAGTEIANVWRASHDVVNDAGEMKELADALRFSILSSQSAANP